MTPKLLTAAETAGLLHMDRKTFRRHADELCAGKLRRVMCGRYYKYVAASIDAMIDNAVKKEIPLVSVGPSGIGGEYQKEI